MSKTSRKKVNKTSTLQSLQASRTGGQVALRGYSYQFLYSCLLILTSIDAHTEYRLEGIEDIDQVDYLADDDVYTHIQLKCSKFKKNASFMDDVLANFLEAYLIDSSHYFKMVYDFDVANGQLQNLLSKNLDKSSRGFWMKKIDQIRTKHPDWQWENYSFDEFLGHMSFEKVKNEDLEQDIQDALIKRYRIDTNNESLFIQSIKVFCFEKMKDRGRICLADVDSRIAAVKADISKGSYNPANQWLQDIYFPEEKDRADTVHDSGFYEGKRPTTADIACGLPVLREALCQEIQKSVDTGNVTVIKAASGQGKSTLALQAVYDLRGTYTPYQLHRCAGAEDVGHIDSFIRNRIRMGQRPLILIDNLDRGMSAWNDLVMRLQSGIYKDYRILVTTRESDWYLYSGDTSQIRNMKFVSPKLFEREAREIYDRLRQNAMIAPGVNGWKSAWNQISERKLLLEYIYLLTHGTMLSERIASQMKDISNGLSGRVKTEILRRVCFADVCGIQLPLKRLLRSMKDETDADPSELLHSLEHEFLIHVNETDDVIEGLHPVRSQHIVEYLHQYHPIEDTVLALTRIVEEDDLRGLFFHLPEYDIHDKDFFKSAVELLWDNDTFNRYIGIIEGLFAGEAQKYYQDNKAIFEEANRLSSILLFSTETCPFVPNRNFGVEGIDILRGLYTKQPYNSSFKRVCQLEEQLPSYHVQQTYLGSFCTALTDRMFHCPLEKMNSISQCIKVAEWLCNIGVTFPVTESLPLELIWKERDSYDVGIIADLFYVYYLQDREAYLNFVSSYGDEIFSYLRQATCSVKISTECTDEEKQIKVIYILEPDQTKAANDQSVSRLQFICKMLPLYDTYCSQALRMHNEVMEFYELPDDSVKHMPIGNVALSFHKRQVSLWTNAIDFNYQYSSFSEWMDYWYEMRTCICQTEKNICDYICKTIQKPTVFKAKDSSKPAHDYPLNDNPLRIDFGDPAERRDRWERSRLTQEYDQLSRSEQFFPESNGIFGDKDTVSKDFGDIRSGYFASIGNVFFQIEGFLDRNKDTASRLFLNIRETASKVASMQEYFRKITPDPEHQKKHTQLLDEERRALENLSACCTYFHEWNGTADPYIDKYRIRIWYQQYLAQELEETKQLLQQTSDDFQVTYPQQTYQDGSLRYYPIIVGQYDINSADDNLKLISDCYPFLNSPYEYLVILIRDETERVARIAVKISTFLFKNLRDQAEKDSTDDSSTKILNRPVPVPVTDQIRNCFDEPLQMKEADVHKEFMETEAEIEEKLWDYSRYRELLTDPRDEEYKQRTLERLRKETKAKIESASKSLTEAEAKQIWKMYKKAVTE